MKMFSIVTSHLLFEVGYLPCYLQNLPLELMEFAYKGRGRLGATSDCKKDSHRWRGE